MCSNSSARLSSESENVGHSSVVDIDEVKIFECDINGDEEENTDRLSPVIRDEEPSSSTNHPSHDSSSDRRSSDQQQFHSFFPYLLSPYYHQANPSFNTDTKKEGKERGHHARVHIEDEKMSSLESLSKFISPPSAHTLHNTGMTSAFPPNYAQHWSPMFPFAFPLDSTSSPKRSAHIRRIFNGTSPHDNSKEKKSHIKKPLNAFMLFMKEQRAQVVQECTLRESAAINQILGRKWHELDRNVQQKYYDMARDERMKHMQLYPGWSARDNYGARKKRVTKGKKRDKNQECLNQKKCRARFGLDQQVNWCKHCKRKKKCLRYTENETFSSNEMNSWSGEEEDEDEEEEEEDSDECDATSIAEQKTGLLQQGISIDSDEENKLRLLKSQQISNIHGSMMGSKRDSSSFSQPIHHYPYFEPYFSSPASIPMANPFKQES